MKEIPLSTFKGMNATSVEGLSCVKLTSNCELIGYFLPKKLVQEGMIFKVEGMMGQINAAYGKE